VKNFEPMRQAMKMMSGQGLWQRLKMGTQLSKMMAAGAMPKFKSNTTATNRILSKKDKRRQRKR
jgi:hypothetical protein